MKYFLILLCFSIAFLGRLYGAEEMRTVRGKAILGEDVNNIVPGATVSYQSARSGKTDLKTDENGEFEIKIMNDTAYVEVMAPGGNFGKMVIVQPTESEFVVSLELTASVRGNVIDRRSEQPLVGQKIAYLIHMNASGGGGVQAFMQEMNTNEKGEYEFRNIPTGVQCNVFLPCYDYGETETNLWYVVGHELELQPGEDRKLRDCTFDPRPEGSLEYVFQVYKVHHRVQFYYYIRYAISDIKNLYEGRLGILLERAKQNNKGIFAIFVRDKLEGDPLSKDFRPLSAIYETLFDDDDVFEQTERFYMMCVLMQPPDKELISADMAEEFVKSRKIDMPLPALFSFAFFDADGKLQGIEPFDHTAPAEKRKQDLIEMLKKY